MAPNARTLGELLSLDRVLELKARTKEQALRELATACALDGRVSDGEAFYQAILRRERQVSTGVGMGIAIPHVKIPEVGDYIAAVGRSSEGIPFDALDGQPVHLIFMIGASDRQTREFVKILAQVTHLLKPHATREALMAAQIPEPFLEIIRAYG